MKQLILSISPLQTGSSHLYFPQAISWYNITDFENLTIDIHYCLYLWLRNIMYCNTAACQTWLPISWQCLLTRPHTFVSVSVTIFAFIFVIALNWFPYFYICISNFICICICIHNCIWMFICVLQCCCVPAEISDKLAVCSN